MQVKLGLCVSACTGFWSCQRSAVPTENIHSEITPIVITDTKLWPIPASVNSSTDRCNLPVNFTFAIMNDTSVTDAELDLLSFSVDRFRVEVSHLLSFAASTVSGGDCPIHECGVIVNSTAPVTWFDDVETEAYVLIFNATLCLIRCNTRYGCMHGMKTFMQFVEPLDNNSIPKEIEVQDMPQFAHRGLLIDTGRRFLQPETIKRHIDMLSATKMNILHWHMTDDFAFPVSLPGFPELAAKGAFSSKTIYSSATVRDLVKYANERGVKILPELDMPGHTTSWFYSHPELMGDALNATDPTRPETFDFLKAVINDTVNLFQTKFIHLGGDELDKAWDTAPIIEWMKANNMKTHADLVQYWMSKIDKIAQDLGITVILWEDFIPSLKESFRNDYPNIRWQMWMKSTSDSAVFASSTPHTIFSTNFYLDHLDKKWPNLYTFGQEISNQALDVLGGGEACMWGEWVDDTNILPRTWPRAAAVAETLWSHPANTAGGPSVALLRLAKWRCRMIEFWGYNFIEPLGQVSVSDPEIEMTWHTDKSQWHCRETDLVR